MISKCASKEEPFVVHFINSAKPLGYDVMRIATDMTEQYPIILFNVSNGQVRSARSSIPKKQTSERFDAKKWLEDTFNAVGMRIDVTGNDCRTRNDCSVCDYPSMNENVDAAEISRIQKEAEMIFKKNIRSLN